MLVIFLRSDSFHLNRKDHTDSPSEGIKRKEYVEISVKVLEIKIIKLLNPPGHVMQQQFNI